MTNNKTQQTDPDAQHYLQVYQQVWSIYQTINDNHFKRTQILMFAIQVAAFAALVKLIGDTGSGNIFPESELKVAALWTVPLAGFLSALAWATLTTREWNTLELYRRYMRYLERVLLNKSVPLAPFTLEKAVFTKQEQKCILFDSCPTTGDSQIRSGDGELEYFPDYGDRGRMKIRMMRMEECMAVFLMSFWFACFATLSVYRFHRTPHCFWFAIIFGIVWIAAFAFEFWGYKYLKTHWGHKRKATKKFSEFMQKE